MAFIDGIPDFTLKVLKINDLIQEVLPAGVDMEIDDFNARLHNSQFALGTVTSPKAM